MKVSGFTFVRNAVKLGYPVVAAIRFLFERATGVRIGEYRNYRRLAP